MSKTGTSALRAIHKGQMTAIMLACMPYASYAGALDAALHKRGGPHPADGHPRPGISQAQLTPPPQPEPVIVIEPGPSVTPKLPPPVASVPAPSAPAPSAPAPAAMKAAAPASVTMPQTMEYANKVRVLTSAAASAPITMRDAGLKGLVAPVGEESGVVAARIQKLPLKSGSKMTLDLAGDGLLNVTMDDATAAANQGLAGAHVAVSASQARQTVDRLIDTGGALHAGRVLMRNGEIILEPLRLRR